MANRTSVWLRALRVLLLAYVAICALLYFNQRALIYPGDLTRVSAAETNFSLERPDAMLRGWQFNPGRERALIYFGGNAERIDDAAHWLAQALPDTSIYALAYRGYGASDGAPDEATLFADALALFDTVRSSPAGRPVSLVGRSLGSGVASHVAGYRPVERLALVTPFDSLAALAQSLYPLLPVRWLIHDRYESTRYLANFHGELLIVRAGNDRIVTPASTDRLIASLGRKVPVLTLDRAGHNDIDDDTRYRRTLIDFLSPDRATTSARSSNAPSAIRQ